MTCICVCKTLGPLQSLDPRADWYRTPAKNKKKQESRYPLNPSVFRVRFCLTLDFCSPSSQSLVLVWTMRHKDTYTPQQCPAASIHYKPGAQEKKTRGI